MTHVYAKTVRELGRVTNYPVYRRRVLTRELPLAANPLDYLAERLWKYPSANQLYKAPCTVWPLLTPMQTATIIYAGVDSTARYHHLFQYWYFNFKRSIWRLTDENFGLLLWLSTSAQEIARDPEISDRLATPALACAYAVKLARDRVYLTPKMADKLHDLYLTSLSRTMRRFTRRRVLNVSAELARQQELTKPTTEKEN